MFRHAGLAEAGVLGVAVGLGLALAAESWAQATWAAETGGWSWRVGGTYALHRDLREDYFYSPARLALKVPVSGWERK